MTDSRLDRYWMNIEKFTKFYIIYKKMMLSVYTNTSLLYIQVTRQLGYIVEEKRKYTEKWKI